MIQTQSPDARKAEYAGELEINKFLLKQWCGMEVMGYRISLDCWACGLSAKQPCLKRGQYLDFPHTKDWCRGTSALLLQQGDLASIHLNVFKELHVRLGCHLHLGFIFPPLTSNWVWVWYTWYLTHLFLRNQWDGSLLSKIKHFSRPWISLMSSLFPCFIVKQWPSGPFTAVLLSLRASVQKDFCCFSKIEYVWFFSSFLVLWGQGMSSNLVSVPPAMLALPSQHWQSMKPLLGDRRGEELRAAISPKYFQRGEWPCTYQKGWSPSKKKKKKKKIFYYWVWDM